MFKKKKKSLLNYYFSSDFGGVLGKKLMWNFIVSRKGGGGVGSIIPKRYEINFAPNFIKKFPHITLPDKLVYAYL